MAITAPLAGAYTTLYGGNALGYTRQGFNLNFVQKGERIEETDLYGLSLIEIIGRGSQMTIDTICKLWFSSTYGALWPWASTFGNVYTAAAPISRQASSIGGAIVMTVVANTPAAVAASPTSLTATKSILSPDQNLQVIFNSVHREVPLRWDVLTIDTTGTGSLFSTT